MKPLPIKAKILIAVAVASGLAVFAKAMLGMGQVHDYPKFLAYLLVFVVLDQWVVRDGFGVGWRWALLSTLMLSTIAWLVWKIGIPSFRTVNGLFAAVVSILPSGRFHWTSPPPTAGDGMMSPVENW